MPRLGGRPRARWLTVAAVLCMVTSAPVSRAAVSQTTALAETTAFEVEVRDGAVLRGHVTLPEGDGPFATILELSPYFNTQAGGDSSAGPTTGAQQEYLDAGFAIAQVNMRGTGLSDGCLQFGNAIDSKDAYEVIEALADGSWSNGNVGMIGHSYSAWSQYMAVAADPPSLKAVIPTSGVSDPYELLTRRGAPIHYGPLLAPVWTVATGWAANENNAAHVCGDLYAEHVQGTADLIDTGDRTAYWKERNLRPALKNTDVAVWRSNGLNYWGEGHWMSYDGEWDLLDPGRTRMILGQWSHETPTSNRDDWYDNTIAWFDHYLRGAPATVAPGVVEFQDTAGGWHEAGSWPPDADFTTLHLSGTSLVDGAKEVQESQQAFVTAPGVEPGFACGAHQAFYVSPPLEEDVVLAGYFDADLTVTDSMPGGNLVAVLRHLPSELPCGVDASDMQSLLADTPETAVGHLQMDLRHWKTPGKHRDFPVLEPTKVSVPSGPFASFVPAGERLVLFIGGGSAELEPDRFQPALTVSTGQRLAGSIRIPVFKGELRFGGE
ncbi:MAG: CocE/NonD family hydrolase [Actinomycetota bacterium]